jgi:hypothetical protein
VREIRSQSHFRFLRIHLEWRRHSGKDRKAFQYCLRCQDQLGATSVILSLAFVSTVVERVPGLEQGHQTTGIEAVFQHASSPVRRPTNPSTSCALPGLPE